MVKLLEIILNFVNILDFCTTLIICKHSCKGNHGKEYRMTWLSDYFNHIYILFKDKNRWLTFQYLEIGSTPTTRSQECLHVYLLFSDNRLHVYLLFSDNRLTKFTFYTKWIPRSIKCGSLTCLPFADVHV